MPELPEVETVRRGLAEVADGATILDVQVNRADLRYPFPPAFRKRLAGRRILHMGRRGKYLVCRLDDDTALIMHLGMSGSFRIETDSSDLMPGVFHYKKPASRKHDHVVFDLVGQQGNTRIVYNDPRRFGFMDLTACSEIDQCRHFASMGIEPTGNALDGEAIACLFDGKTTTLKAALLDQRLISGLGNIYVCEALWRARLSPRRKASTIVRRGGKATNRSEALATHIRDVIAEAIEAGGSSLRDHRQANGELGYFQHHFSAYDREGEPCPRQQCDGHIRRIVQNGRSTFFCPSCQR